ncbi:hypothetical protein QTP88_005738 [Uroleucon formosanum]
MAEEFESRSKLTQMLSFNQGYKDFFGRKQGVIIHINTIIFNLFNYLKGLMPNRTVGTLLFQTESYLHINGVEFRNKKYPILLTFPYSIIFKFGSAVKEPRSHKHAHAEFIPFFKCIFLLLTLFFIKLFNPQHLGSYFLNEQEGTSSWEIIVRTVVGAYWYTVSLPNYYKIYNNNIIVRIYFAKIMEVMSFAVCEVHSSAEVIVFTRNGFSSKQITARMYKYGPKSDRSSTTQSAPHSIIPNSHQYSTI